MQKTIYKMIGYSHLFGESQPKDVNSLLSNIPSDILLGYLSMINALIYTKKSIPFIINEILPTLKPTEQFFYVNRIYKIYTIDQKSEPINLVFRTETVLRFINYELLNFRRLPKTSLMPGDDLKIFKAYIWFVNHQIDELDQSEVLTDFLTFEFQKRMWPILVKQYEFSIHTTSLYKEFKVRLFFDFMNINFKEYCDKYLINKGYESLDRLLSDHMNLIWMIVDEDKSKYSPNYQIRLSKSNSLFDSLTIDVNNIVASNDQSKDFVHIKERPLYLDSRSIYNVLSWDFLFNIYDISFLFDFYKLSGIQEKYATFLAFKAFYGNDFMEKVYFRKIINAIFYRKYQFVKFDDTSIVGLPDCYVRDGNVIYLFECKDALMPSNVVTASTYKSILSDLEKKFVKNEGGQKKGIKQLVDTILKIESDSPYVENLDSLNIKRDKLVIMPIIVYSHSLYRLPGVNNYLNSRFQEEMIRSGIKVKSRKIYPLTLMSFDYIVDCLPMLRNNKIKLKDIIDEYWGKIFIEQKKINKLDLSRLDPTDRVNYQMNVNRSIEDVTDAIVGQWKAKNFRFKSFLETVNLVLDTDHT